VGSFRACSFCNCFYFKSSCKTLKLTHYFHMYTNRSKKYIVFPNSSPVYLVVLFLHPLLIKHTYKFSLYREKKKHQEILLFTLVKGELFKPSWRCCTIFNIFLSVQRNILLRIHPKYLCIKGTGSRDRIQIFWQKFIILGLNKSLLQFLSELWIWASDELSSLPLSKQYR
jgi:hypothetical protein